MGRRPCCAKEGLNRGAWTAMEDKTLTDYINLYGEGSWRNLPKRAGLKRCGKSCRLRWLNYLRPDIKRGNISSDEEELIVRLHKLLGNRWSLIAGRLPGRTDNEIKNYWNTNLSKRVQDRQQRTSSNNKTTKKSNTKRDGNPINNPNPKLQPMGPDPSRIIRTKAVKCSSRVFINPPLIPPTKPPLPPSPPEDPTRVHFDTNNNNLDSVEDNLEDFPMVDFSMMGELNLSEFLDSQQFSDFCCETSNEGDQHSPSSPILEEPIVFSEEMMDDWRRSAFAIDPSTVEYWLGE